MIRDNSRSNSSEIAEKDVQRAKAERINSLAIFQAQMTLHGNLQLSTHAEKVGDLNNSRERVLPWRPGREVMNKLYGLHYFKQMWIVALANTLSSFVPHPIDCSLR